MAEKTDRSTAPAAPSSGPADDAARREITLRIDEAGMESSYANTFRVESTGDEVIIDFGMNRGVPGKPNELVFKARHEIILTWRGAKQLTLALSNRIRQYEERFGEIELNPRGKPRAAND